jgi:tetratricopeptide (TPR) repeat protein
MRDYSERIVVGRQAKVSAGADQVESAFEAKQFWNAAKRCWKAGEKAEAIASAEKAAELTPESPSYHLDLAKYRFHSDDALGAISGLKSAAEKVSDAEQIYARLAELLYKTEQPEEALSFFSRILREDDKSHDRWLLHARILLALKRTADARDSALRAIAIDPDDPGPYLLLVELFLAEGQVEAAQQWIERTLNLPSFEPNMLVKLAGKFKKRRQYLNAWTILERLAPDNRAAQKLRVIIRYLREDITAARHEAVRYARLFDASMQHVSLPELFGECLRQAQEDEQEPEFSRWLWSRMNLPASSRDAWLVRLRWGLRINRLMREWILAHRERLDALDEIVEPPDWSLLDAAKAEGRPVVLAGAHLGPAFVGVHYLDRTDHPLVMVAGDLSYSLAVGSKRCVSVAETHVILQLRDTLAGLGTVYMAGDGPHGRSRCPVKLLGSTAYLREGVAALARVSQARTFWYAARWVGHKIALDLIPGPTALDDESREAWNARWFSFYIAQFERQLGAGPENVRRTFAPKSSRI